MQTQKMTIHRALSELKLMDAKIEKQIKEIMPSGIHQKGKLINGYISESDFRKAAQSKFDSINELITRKNRIKSAIVTANGITKVKIGGNEMTIADAINLKAVVKFKKELVESLRGKYQQTVASLNNSNSLVERNMQAILEATFGKDDVEAVRKPYMEANEFYLFNPLKVAEKIEAIEKEVGEFEAEVDAVLSEINAITLIEI